MMDERTHHPLMRVPAVAVSELKKLGEQHPGVRFLACCIFQSELSRLKGIDNVWAELSYIESSETLVNAIGTIGDSRLVFGSHSPFLYFQAESNKLKVDPNFVSPDSIAKIVHTNPELLLQGR
jgi:predicted TIM-barrel fold metal-dependent hydrolase